MAHDINILFSAMYSFITFKGFITKTISVPQSRQENSRNLTLHYLSDHSKTAQWIDPKFSGIMLLSYRNIFKEKKIAQHPSKR